MKLFSPRSASSNVQVGAERGTADLTGWLHKRGENNTAFKSRFFVLTGKRLAYFEGDGSKDKPKGEMALDGSVCEAVESATKGRFRLQLTVTAKGYEGRTYVMEAADEATREKWVNTLMRAAVSEARPTTFPEGIALEQVVGPSPSARTWRQEWSAMRMEQLRSMGATQLATRQQCGSGGSEGIERWTTMRTASIEWKRSQGWDAEHAVAYTLLTACNRAALARSVRERSGQYAASMHLISRALGLRVKPLEPAPDTYYHLIGNNGLATTDSTWAALLDPAAAPGMKFVTTANSIARDDPNCFPIDDQASKSCRGVHEKLIVGGGADTRYAYELKPSPVVKFLSAVSSAGDVANMSPPAHHTMVCVDGEGNRWELPALATITLVGISPPGSWGAYAAATVDRTLYTVSVAWMASAAPEPVATRGDAAEDGIAALDIS